MSQNLREFSWNIAYRESEGRGESSPINGNLCMVYFEFANYALCHNELQNLIISLISLKSSILLFYILNPVHFQ